MPLMWLRAYLATMPQLQAEEAFWQAEIISVGSGKLTEKGRDRIIRRWEKALGREGQSMRSIRLTGTTKDLELMRSVGMGGAVGSR
jgi:hypothetical protein